MGGKLGAEVGQEGRGIAGEGERHCCWRGIAGAEVACTCSEGSGAGTVGSLGIYQTMPVGSFSSLFFSFSLASNNRSLSMSWVFSESEPFLMLSLTSRLSAA